MLTPVSKTVFSETKSIVIYLLANLEGHEMVIFSVCHFINVRKSFKSVPTVILAGKWATYDEITNFDDETCPLLYDTWQKFWYP